MLDALFPQTLPDEFISRSNAFQIEERGGSIPKGPLIESF